MCSYDGSLDDSRRLPYIPIDEPGSPFYDFITALNTDGIDGGSFNRGISDDRLKGDEPHESPATHICNYWSKAFKNAAYDQFPKNVAEANAFFINCPEGMRHVVRAIENLRLAMSHYDINLLKIGSGCEDGGARIGVGDDLNSVACPGVEVVSFRLFKGSTGERKWAMEHLPICQDCAEAVGVLQSLTGG